MSASKRPSTSSLRRFICSRPYVPIAEIRRRFGLDEAEGMFRVDYRGGSAFVGLPEREGLKLQDLLNRDEIGLELSVEVNAPVVVGIYPMRIARYFLEGTGNGYHPNGQHPQMRGQAVPVQPPDGATPGPEPDGVHRIPSSAARAG
jgi:hypothetical protein